MSEDIRLQVSEAVMDEIDLVWGDSLDTIEGTFRIFEQHSMYQLQVAMYQRYVTAESGAMRWPWSQEARLDIRPAYTMGRLSQVDHYEVREYM